MLVLPDLIKYCDYTGKDKEYLDVVYSFFKIDFVDNRPIFNGVRLGLKKHPQEDGKEATFWHFITTGNVEKNRYPDIPRCERIRWPKPIIDKSSSKNIRVWENKRNTKKGIQERICICYGDWEYLVILTKRKDYLLPWTAYPIQYDKDKRKLENEYNLFNKKTPI